VVNIPLTLNHHQTAALAALAARMALRDLRDIAKDDNEAYEMLYALENLRQALGAVGYWQR
jgi:hypothetical protein